MTASFRQLVAVGLEAGSRLTALMRLVSAMLGQLRLTGLFCRTLLSAGGARAEQQSGHAGHGKLEKRVLSHAAHPILEATDDVERRSRGDRR